MTVRLPVVASSVSSSVEAACRAARTGSAAAGPAARTVKFGSVGNGLLEQRRARGSLPSSAVVTPRARVECRGAGRRSGGGGRARRASPTRPVSAIACARSIGDRRLALAGHRARDEHASSSRDDARRSRARCAGSGRARASSARRSALANAERRTAGPPASARRRYSRSKPSTSLMRRSIDSSRKTSARPSASPMRIASASELHAADAGRRRRAPSRGRGGARRRWRPSAARRAAASECCRPRRCAEPPGSASSWRRRSLSAASMLSMSARP